MFPFFKKKKEQPIAESPKEAELSDLEKEELQQLIVDLQQQIRNQSLSESDRAKSYENLGLAFGRLGKTQEAIEHLEKSLVILPSIDDGYKLLMSLYNKKRAEAARAGDDAGIEYYMNKMDEMRQIAKITTLKR